MSELYTPTPIEVSKSPDFYECPTSQDFSPEVLEHIQWMLAKNKIDLETPQGHEFLFKISQKLYSPTDPDHGWPHIATVKHHGHRLAMIYELSDQKRYALFSGICLHDVVRCGVNNPAILSAEIAERVLSPHMRPQTVQMAVDAIAQHSLGRMQRYKNDPVTMLLYEADKSHTDRWRWFLPWGFDPNKYNLNEDTVVPLEEEYEKWLQMVHGTAATYYMKNIIEQRMRELEELKKNAGVHLL